MFYCGYTPIISTMRIQVVPVPTNILSTHTQFPVYHFDDYTKHMPEYIQTYKDLKLEFDGIATGFLGSKEQVEIVIDFIQSFKRKRNICISRSSDGRPWTFICDI